MTIYRHQGLGRALRRFHLGDDIQEADENDVKSRRLRRTSASTAVEVVRWAFRTGNPMKAGEVTALPGLMPPRD